ncbi:MAG: 6-carboxytetrahydropterin synthase, partial [Planctomycetes bacterium]|nr:6-carboxytetrahydropterin synthase [Planctomycetota bacterium]
PSFKDIFVLPLNPTAENLAYYLLHEVCPKELKGMGVIVHKVVLWETENCYAEVDLDPKDAEVIASYK